MFLIYLSTHASTKRRAHAGNSGQQRATAGSIADCAIGALRMRSYLKLVLHVKGVTMNYRKLLFPSLIAVTVSTLSACGGGLDDVLNKAGLINATGKVDKTEFLGTWVISPSTVSSCISLGSSTALYADPNTQKYTFSDDQLTISVLTFSNFGCKEDAGELLISYAIQWAPLQFTARQNVAGVSGTLKSATLAGNDVTSLLSTSETTATYKNVADVVDGKLAFGKGSAALSADGYPNEIADPFLIRGK